jgi:predicted dehydrogenase/threonine dehydrogenase-like Zn-dependent dehydrogenase
MKQLLQNVSTGEITVEEVPAPVHGPATLLVAPRFSLISAGTERAVLELGRASLVEKARARPDLVQKVVDSARTEGIAATYAKVRGRLGEPNALGYSLAGTVLEGCADGPAAPGELVACAGAGWASHAEVVNVPRHLCARVPAGVAAEDAAYSTVAAIALHGIRLAELHLGDVAAVIGLGLVGQLALELLAAAGCVPLGIDPDPRRAALAQDAGFLATSDPGELGSEVRRLTSGRGADGVLITAASKSSEPLHTAGAVARDRAVLSIVGDVRIESPRAPLFTKELRVVVSRSYGPGRYDPTYEEAGVDYPAGYVRWTEGRNLEEVLRLIGTGQLRPSRLTTHTFDLADGPRAYELLGADEPSLGILLRYPERISAGSRSVHMSLNGRRRVGRDRVRVGVIGAGTFARSVLIPVLGRGAELTAVATRTGVSARATAQRFGAGLATTDPAEVLASEQVDAVIIATRHNLHAELAVAALKAGKHVFVEKPLALSEAELTRVHEAASTSTAVLMVGFNRRFAPLAVQLRETVAVSGPMLVNYRINAGRLPRSHWTHDPEQGGGRIVGETCHFVDFASYLCAGPPHVLGAEGVSGSSEPLEDTITATLRFDDGSLATIVYSALGDSSLEKERVEVLSETGAGVLSDFNSLTLHRAGHTEVAHRKRDKGHAREIAVFLEACRSGRQPWPVEDMVAVTRATFAMRDSVRARGG